MHLEDLIPINSTIEIKPLKKISNAELKDVNNITMKPDGYIQVGFFDENGLASGEVDYNFFGSITNLRIIIQMAVQNWIVINDISLE